MRKKRKQKRKRRTHKYQIREHPQNMRVGNMLDDLGDVHNHFLALEDRYYRIYGKYAGRYRSNLPQTSAEGLILSPLRP